MDDRQLLLEAIRANPAEDLPRLAYADYLEEHGSGSLDTHTIEFIRVSCQLRQSRANATVMPRAAYVWIRENWEKLIPAVLNLSEKVSLDDLPVEFGILAQREEDCYWKWISGRNVRIHLRLRAEPYTVRGRKIQKHYICVVGLEFWKGFVIGLEMPSVWGRSVVEPVLRKEQPLLGSGTGYLQPEVKVSV